MAYRIDVDATASICRGMYEELGMLSDCHDKYDVKLWTRKNNALPHAYLRCNRNDSIASVPVQNEM